ncbi:MAG: redoxin domain-containing protein [Pyrinomonadaceae bacterium]
MPEVGDIAPDFELSSHMDRNKKVKLSDFRGKQNVVLAFYPMAWTSTCSAQIPAYEADLERFKSYNAQVLGISVDSSASNAAWAKSFGNFTYDLLSDFHPKGVVAQTYGVYREDDGFADRAIFVVDKEGKIAYKRLHNLGEQPDNEEVLEVLRKL